MRKVLIAAMFVGAVIWGLSVPKITPVHAQAGSGCPSSTALGTAACNLAPGHFVEFTAAETGLQGITEPPIGCGSITEYSDRGMWDPTHKRAYIMGGAHCGGAPYNQDDQWGYWNDATNAWVNLGYPCTTSTSTASGCAGSWPPQFRFSHSYESMTMIPSSGDIYYTSFTLNSQIRIYHYVYSTGTWTNDVPDDNSAGYVQVAQPLVYFPDRNALEFVNGGDTNSSMCTGTGSGGACGAIYEYSFTSGTWTKYGTGNSLYFDIGQYQDFATYSAFCKCMVFGGGEGNSGLYQMNANGTFTTLSNSPMATGIFGTISSVDPASGYLVFTDPSANTWTYDQFKMSWTELSGQSNPLVPGPDAYPLAEIVAIPIPTYNVIMYIGASSSHSQEKVYLYKYTTPGTGDWIQRSEQPNVFFKNPLAASGDLGSTSYGAVFGHCCSGSTQMAVDSTLYPANGGSMKCAIPSGAPGDDPCDDAFFNFAAGLTEQNTTNGTNMFTDTASCGTGCLGNTFYLQMMMYLPSAYFSDMPANGEGQKNFILGSGDPSSCTTSSTTTCNSSCTYAEIVMLNNSYRGNSTGNGIPQLYQNCGDYNPLESAVSTSWNPDNYLLQPNQNNCYQYLNPTGGQTGSTFFSPYGNCLGYGAGAWFSVEIEVSLGTYSGGYYNGSTINLWIAPLGQSYGQPWASYTYNIHDQSHLGYGKVWLLTYDTAATSWTGNYKVNWAQLIGSTSFIAAPAVPADSPGSSTNVTLSPSSENYGSVNVGSSSSAVTFTVTNNNSASATSAYVSVTGTNSSDFSLSSNSCGTSGSTITLSGSGATCTVNVTFTPSAAGSRSATLNFIYSGADGASPQTAALSGTGIAISSKTALCPACFAKNLLKELNAQW